MYRVELDVMSTTVEKGGRVYRTEGVELWYMQEGAWNKSVVPITGTNASMRSYHIKQGDRSPLHSYCTYRIIIVGRAHHFEKVDVVLRHYRVYRG